MVVMEPETVGSSDVVEVRAADCLPVTVAVASLDVEQAASWTLAEGSIASRPVHAAALKVAVTRRKVVNRRSPSPPARTS